MNTANLDYATDNSALDHLALDMVLPWHEHSEQQEKFKKLIKKVIAPFMVLLLLIPFLPDFSEEQEVIKKVVTKVILDPPKIEPQPLPETAATPPQPKLAKAKPKAPSKVGTKDGQTNLATLSQQLSAMRNSVNLSKLQKKNVFVSNSGSVKQSSRALLGKKNATTSSGGLKSSDITVNAKGVAMMEHQSTTIDNPTAAINLPSKTQFYDPKKQTRSGQSIRRTVERAKGALFALYNKALRRDPNLAGRFVFSFQVSPSGSISQVKLITSDLNNNKLEKALLDKIRAIEFEKEDVESGSFQYTFDFLPS